jgi:hypothetical protein
MTQGSGFLLALTTQVLGFGVVGLRLRVRMKAEEFRVKFPKPKT